MSEDSGHRAFALKKIADDLLKRDMDGILPLVRCADGSDVYFDSFKVDRGIFQFCHTFKDVARATLTCVPVEMIVWIRASVPVPSADK